MLTSLSVRCIVRVGPGVVMVRHRDDDPANSAGEFWVLPGGDIEPGEGVMTAAEREVLEETGLTVRAVAVQHLREFEWDPVRPPHGWPSTGRSLEVYVRAEVMGGELALGFDPEIGAGEAPVLLESAVMTPERLRGVLHFPEYLLEMLDGPLAARFEGAEYFAAQSQAGP